jgi:hypothetical protein
VLPEQRSDVSRLAARLGHGAQFAASGMVVERPPQQQRSSGQRRRRR